MQRPGFKFYFWYTILNCYTILPFRKRHSKYCENFLDLFKTFPIEMQNQLINNGGAKRQSWTTDFWFNNGYSPVRTTALRGASLLLSAWSISIATKLEAVRCHPFWPQLNSHQSTVCRSQTQLAPLSFLDVSSSVDVDDNRTVDDLRKAIVKEMPGRFAATFQRTCTLEGQYLSLPSLMFTPFFNQTTQKFRQVSCWNFLIGNLNLILPPPGRQRVRAVGINLFYYYLY